MLKADSLTLRSTAPQPRLRNSPPYLGMVMHFVLMFCVVMAFSNSSSCPVFFSFFTRLLTAFSHHFSSWPFCSPFFQPRSLLTMGGVKGKIDIFQSSVKSVQCREARWFGPKRKTTWPYDGPNGGSLMRRFAKREGEKKRKEKKSKAVLLYEAKL